MGPGTGPTCQSFQTAAEVGPGNFPFGLETDH